MSGPSCTLLAVHGQPVVVRQAHLDDALMPVAKLMMLHLAERLDFHEYREVKVESLAHEMGIKYATCAKALRVLVARGYLDEHDKRKPRAVRLPWSRRTTQARAA